MNAKQIYCFSGSLTPAFLGCSLASFRDGSIPLGLAFGGATIIATPFVLKCLTPFVSDYAKMMASYFSSPIKPVVNEESKIDKNLNGRKLDFKHFPEAKQVSVLKRNQSESDVSFLKTVNKVNDFSSNKKEIGLRHSYSDSNFSRSKAAKVGLEPINKDVKGFHKNPLAGSGVGFKKPDNLCTPTKSLGGGASEIFDIRKRTSSEKRRGSKELVFYTPHTENSRTQSPVFSTEEERTFEKEDFFPGWTESLVKNLRSLEESFSKGIRDSDFLFYSNLSLGTVTNILKGTRVKGIPNTQEIKVMHSYLHINNSYVISALQSFCHNDYFLKQLKEVRDNNPSLSLDQKKLIKRLESLLRSFSEASKADQIEYKMTSVRDIVQKINKNSGLKDNNAVEFVGSIFRSLNINNFTLFKPGSNDHSPKELQILKIPVQEETLAKNIRVFFSNHTLQGPLPDLFTIELTRVNRGGRGITKTIDVEQEIDFAPYLKEQKKGESIYKIAAAICCLEDRYVTFVRSEGKWLLCDDVDITEVSAPYFKEASAFIFEKVE